MNVLKKEQTKRDVLKGGLRTKDVGVLCKRAPSNDKGIMVGTTSIAALKAEYGDDFTNFEIIQDVGYSSESSTHLSGDDAGTDRPFSFRIYKYSKDIQPLNLREELEAVIGSKNFLNLSSSLESSSSAAASLHDSGLGTGEALTTSESRDALELFRAEDVYDQEDVDYLEKVLDECGEFGVSEPEELHFNLSGIESDDPTDTFHNRSSFTTSTQNFYKMISVDSDNGEGENPTAENTLTVTEVVSSDVARQKVSPDTSTVECNNNDPKNTSDAEHDITIRNQSIAHEVETTSRWNQSLQNSSHRHYCSTPVRNAGCQQERQSLKRKRDQDTVDGTKMSTRIQSWLNRCATELSNPGPSRRSPTKDHRQKSSENASSCDASCECTSSSADEGNIYSSSSSFLDDDFKHKARVDSFSAEESVETVVHALLDYEYTLLPPPPSSTVSCASDCKNSFCRSSKVRRKYKAASEGDIRKRNDVNSTSDSSSHPAVHSHSSSSSQPKQRFYCSLPSIHRHRSDSSTDENYCPTARLSQSDTRTTPCCVTNRSSSSEVSRRRRRSRKKSSSSNKSTSSVHLSSGDNLRRSRHSSNRRRYVSQKTDFLCSEVFSDEEVALLKVEVPVEEDSARFDDIHRFASSSLLSPVERDVVLTHLEEQSTVSDQVWDGYQEMPYLSEGYSEATVDEDAVRKLTDFGDDYGSAIGQPLRILDVRVGGKSKADVKPLKKSSKTVPKQLGRDSDSETEDLHHVIEETEKAIHFARNTLKKVGSLTPADIADVLATCGTHLKCLQSICEHIQCKGKETSFSVSDLTKLHDLIEDWQGIRRNTEMYEKAEDPVRKKYMQAQANVDALFNKMSELASYSTFDADSFSWEDVEKNLSRLQMVLTTLHETKEQLLAVNLQVHRFTTEHGTESDYKDCSLKADITELYRRWEDIYEENGQQLHELELLRTDWRIFSEKLDDLHDRLEQAEGLHSDHDCDNNCLICGEESLTSRNDLEQLERDAVPLRTRLKGEVWNAVDHKLDAMKRKIYARDISVATTPSESANRRNHSILVEEDADDHFEDAIQQLCKDRAQSGLSNPQKKAAAAVSTTPSKIKKSSRLWRIVRMAVPVQVALVLLYCLACYFEPSCCNALNNYNFSLTPQLRYFGGRPPV